VRRLLFLAAIVASAPETALAQEVQLVGPLRGAPSLIARPLLREGRFSLSAVAGFIGPSRGPAAGLEGTEVVYHPVDALGVGAWGGVIETLVQGRTGAGSRAIAAPEVVLTPLHGKACLFGVAFLEVDLHLRAGAAWIAGPNRTGDPTFPVPVAGGGFTTFFAHFMSFGVDYRALGGPLSYALTASLSYWPGHTAYEHDEDGEP
jgi:hypothetical protein